MRRRLNLCAMFVFDILKGRIDAPALVLKLKRSQPLRSLRYGDYLTLDRHRTNYGQFEPVNDMSRTFAHLYGDQMTRWQFRAKIRSAVLTNDMLRRGGFLLTLN